MLFVYECTGNIIADFKKFYDTQLSEQDKKKIFIPTYDCMKRYQGSWHVEQKPLFTDCFFIECRNKEELKTTLSRQHCSDSLAEAVMSGITPLRPEQEEFLKALMQPDTKTRRIVWVSSGSCRSLLSKWNIYYNSFIDCMGCIFDLKWSRKEAKIYNDSWYCYSYRTSSYI